MYLTNKLCVCVCVCVSKPDISSYLCATDLHCCPKTKNTSVSHTVALGDMFLHHHEHTHCSLRGEEVRVLRDRLTRCWLGLFVGFVYNSENMITPALSYDIC